MTTSTTSAIWRSTGGDQTRTAAAGSMVMCQPFYIANVAVSGNVAVSASQPNTPLILPAGAVVFAIADSTTGTGNIDMGFTPLSGVGPGQTPTLGTNVPNGFLVNAPINTIDTITAGQTGAGAFLNKAANLTNLTVVTSAANVAATGSLTGFLTYFVTDPTNGEENV